MTILHVLYVDDDPDIRAIVEMALALDAGTTLSMAASGEAALALIDAGLRPNVILLDLMMPGMDGLALLDALRGRADVAGLPAIFMTARGRQRDLDLLTARGALGVIVKPFDPLGLARQIRTLLGQLPAE